MKKYSLEELISMLDGAAGRLMVASMRDPVVKEAMQMITTASIMLGEVEEITYVDYGACEDECIGKLEADSADTITRLAAHNESLTQQLLTAQNDLATADVAYKAMAERAIAAEAERDTAVNDLCINCQCYAEMRGLETACNICKWRGGTK